MIYTGARVGAEEADSAVKVNWLVPPCQRGLDGLGQEAQQHLARNFRWMMANFESGTAWNGDFLAGRP